MDMGMSVMMRVFVTVNDAITMVVRMGMRPVLERALHPPGEIGDAKRDQCPGGNITAHRFDEFKISGGNADGNTDQAESHRTGDMTQTAHARDRNGFGQGPTPGFSHDDERHIVVRPKQRMDTADGSRS